MKNALKYLKKALDIFTDFAWNCDVWHKFRIAKSLRQLDEPQKALEYLEQVVIVQDNWYVLKEFAENYYMLEDYENTLKYASQGVIAEGYVKSKVNLYYLIYELLKDSNLDFAIKHAKLVLAIKLENGTDVPEDIENLNLNEDNLDINQLEHELKNYWIGKEFEISY